MILSLGVEHALISRRQPGPYLGLFAVQMIHINEDEPRAAIPRNEYRPTISLPEQRRDQHALRVGRRLQIDANDHPVALAEPAPDCPRFRDIAEDIDSLFLDAEGGHWRPVAAPSVDVHFCAGPALHRIGR